MLAIDVMDDILIKSVKYNKNLPNFFFFLIFSYLR